MKIAITAHGEDCHAIIDFRFGRADYFVIYDQDNDSWSAISNMQNLEAAHGAGIQAGQNLAKTSAKVLITGSVGPKAFKVLQAEQIAMYSVGQSNCTVKEALTAFLDNKLTVINS